MLVIQGEVDCNVMLKIQTIYKLILQEGWEQAIYYIYYVTTLDPVSIYNIGNSRSPKIKNLLYNGGQ